MKNLTSDMLKQTPSNQEKEMCLDELEKALEKYTWIVGDQSLIVMLERWLSINMGATYEIRKTN